MGLVRARVLVDGRVQGVWFRESTREHAARAGATGWVRNLADGRVEALLEGERQAVESVLAFLREGPPHARVTSVELASYEEIETRAERAFRVRH